MRPIEFQVHTPASERTLRKHVARSRGRYPEVLAQAPRSGVVHVVANGPSAVNCPMDGPTVALNGALRLFTDRGLAPTWWAACDPQAMVASFLRDPPPETTYLVASKCHKDVFKALKGRRVNLWHVDDTPGHTWAVPTATSVTLTALSLLYRMGWRQFCIWGWDGCYIDGQDHAVPQPHKGDAITVEVNGKSFETTTTWACEAQDAVAQLSGADYRVAVRGEGMIGAILAALAPNKLFDYHQDQQSGLTGREN